MKTINAEVNVRSAFPSDPHDTPLYSHVQYVRQYTVVTYILQCMHHAMALRLRIFHIQCLFVACFLLLLLLLLAKNVFFLACVRSVTFHGNSCIQLKSYIRSLLWHNGSSAYLVFLLLLRFSFSRLCRMCLSNASAHASGCITVWLLANNSLDMHGNL